MAKTKILVLGGGAWGTAFASRLSAREKDFSVFLWSRDARASAEIQKERENKRYLPGMTVHDRLEVSSNLETLFENWQQSTNKTHCDYIIFIAVPSSGFLDICSYLKIFDFPQRMKVVSLCKGVMECDEQIVWPTQILGEFFDESDICVLSGPSFAKEVIQGLPFALTCACKNISSAREVAKLLSGNGVRVYAEQDVLGVEIAGVMKNIIAIAAGVCDGLNLGYNARASLITRGLAETSRFGEALGAHPQTFLGLSALGDIVLTATGSLSRNRSVGLDLAEGKSTELILRDLGHVAEGVNSVSKILRCAKSIGVSLPITSGVNSLVNGNLTAVEIVKELLARDQTDER